jgi:CRP/FNR family cyclic AMP-dependent transcriptional regulator
MQRSTIGSDGAGRLEKVDLFAELSTGQRRMLARIMDEVTAAAGEAIMSEGEPGYEALVIEEGTANVLQDGTPINTIGPGDVFGELAVLGDGAPRTASVVASSSLRAIVLTAHFMREVHDRMPTVGEHIERIAAERRDRDAGRATTRP